MSHYRHEILMRNSFQEFCCVMSYDRYIITHIFDNIQYFRNIYFLLIKLRDIKKLISYKRRKLFEK